MPKPEPFRATAVFIPTAIEMIDTVIRDLEIALMREARDPRSNKNIRGALKEALHDLERVADNLEALVK